MAVRGGIRYISVRKAHYIISLLNLSRVDGEETVSLDLNPVTIEALKYFYINNGD